MPELPEVEVVRSGLALTAAGRTVVAVERRAPALRWPIPEDLPGRLAGRTLRAVERRGKYLLLAFDHGWLIVHLGMSGTIAWTRRDVPVRLHDHLDLVFDDGVLRLNDPRRFGAVLWHDAADGPPHGHPLLASLGVEPFSDAFDAALLLSRHARAARGDQAAAAVGHGGGRRGQHLRVREPVPRRASAVHARAPDRRARYERLADAIRDTLSRRSPPAAARCATSSRARARAVLPARVLRLRPRRPSVPPLRRAGPHASRPAALHLLVRALPDLSAPSRRLREVAHRRPSGSAAPSRARPDGRRPCATLVRTVV
jgi:formamidopyrimidine-DNA glycosylase